MNGGTVYVASDVRVYRDTSGRWISTHSSLSLESLKIYRDRFSHCVVIAREVTQGGAHGLPLSDAFVSVVPLQNNPSQRGLVSGGRAMLQAVRKITLAPGDLLAVRVPELVSLAAWYGTRQRGGARIAFVVAEPAGVAKLFSRRGMYRTLAACMTAVAHHIVRNADGVVYVTREHLQKQLPARPSTAVLARSNVRVDEDRVADAPRSYVGRPTGLKIVTAGGMDGDAKGFDLLLRAVARLRGEGLDVSARVLGSGALLPEYATLAAKLGIGEAVVLPGYVSSQDRMLEEFARADVFVLPSRTEGLPRVLIEAMAQGMAAVGSRAGGIPELLADEDLVEVGSLDDLVESLRRLTNSNEALAKSASRNLSVARDVLRQTRQPVFNEFLDLVMVRSRSR